MVEGSEIYRIKTCIAIADVLASRGIMPVSRTLGELAYHSPLRDDKTPSFYVNIQENGFKDMVVHAHRGDVIRLIQLLDNTGFTQAVQTLLAFEGQTDKPSFFLSGSSPLPGSSRDTIRQVKLLQNATLMRYAESRGIDAGLARTYLHEVHYTHNDHYLYALGFSNDSAGYALRNGVGCKRNIGPADITTLKGSSTHSQACNIFEGFFDFLSALRCFGLPRPTHTTYVLNSIANLTRVWPLLPRYTQVNGYFDRDDAGRTAMEKLQRANLPVKDQSHLYQGYKDVNEFLINHLATNPIDFWVAS